MSERLKRRVQKLEAQQAQRTAAMEAIARERMLRDTLDMLDPQPDDVYLDYDGLLDRLTEAVGKERRRVAEE